MDDKIKEELDGKYKGRGFQKLTLDEYEVLRKEKERREKREIPKFVKILVAIPMYLIAAVGAVLLPYILFLIITSPMEDPAKDSKKPASATALKKQSK